MKTTPIYPAGVVTSLLQTEAVTPATRKVLNERLKMKEGEPRFFTPDQYFLLSVVCDLLMAQDPGNRIVPVAAFIDERLACGTGKGWRYNHLPPDAELYRNGLLGIDQAAHLLFKLPFVALDKPSQVHVMKSIQRSEAPGAIWQQLDAKSFFEELLTEASEIFFCHPLVQEAFGYAGMADGPGWAHIGLDEKEEREPDELIITLGDDAKLPT